MPHSVDDNCAGRLRRVGADVLRCGLYEVGCFTQDDDPQRAAELAGWLAEQLGALAGHFSSVPETNASLESQPAAELRSYAASSLAQSEQWLRAVAEQGAQPEEGSAPGIAGLAAHLNDVRGALHGAAESQMGAAAAADEEATAARQEEGGVSPPRSGSLTEAREAAGTELTALRESLQAEADAEHDGSDVLGEAVTAHIQRVLESLQVRAVFADGPLR